MFAKRAPAGVERAYLALVRDAIRQKPPGSKIAREFRAAVTALGAAIDRLPLLQIVPIDTNALRLEAEALRSGALHRETDPVIAESLERRADAIERRAATHDRSAQQARRTAALRAEIEAQIAALREGIAACDNGTTSTDVAHMAQLAEAARRVAHEADAVSRARAELDAGPQPLSTNSSAKAMTEVVAAAPQAHVARLQ